MPRLGRLAARLTLLAASLLAALAIAEGAVRLLQPQPLVQLRPDIWIPVEGFGHRLAPGLNTVINSGGGDVRVRTDSSGHRVGETPPGEAAFRVLALGDSFLAAFQVEYPETMTARLEARLTDDLDSAVAVVNAGVNDWSPNHYLLEARRELGRRRYDAVLVFLFLGNDLVSRRIDSFPPRQRKGRPLRLPARLDRRELIDALIYPAYLSLRSRSHLTVLVRDRMSPVLRRLGVTRADFPPALLRSEARSPVWRLTASICADIARFAESRGSPSLFVLIPFDYHVDARQAEAYARGAGIDPSLIDPDQPARILGRTMEEMGLSVIDLRPDLRRAWRAGSRLYGRVDRHFTARGHEVAAAAIYPSLRALLASSPGTGS